MNDLPEHIQAWIDRIGNMEFIDDQKFSETDKLQTGYVILSVRLGVFEHATLFI